MSQEQPPEIQEKGRLKSAGMPAQHTWKVVGVVLMGVAGFAFFRANAPAPLPPQATAGKTAVIDKRTPQEMGQNLERDARAGIQNAAAANAQQNPSAWGNNLRGVFDPGHQNMAAGGAYSPYTNPYTPPAQYAQPPAQNPADTRKQAAEQALKEKEEREYKASKAPLLVHFLDEKAAPAATSAERAQFVTVPAKQLPAETATTQQMYTLYQGTWIDTTLQNGLHAGFTGPFKVMVGQDVYDRDHTVVLLKKGTEFLGMAERLAADGQERVAVKFTRLIRQDKFSLEFPEMPGLNQMGETGLKDKVNHHYVRTFTMTAAMGLIAGFSLANTQGGYSYDGWDAYRQGLSMAIGRSATRILDYFLHLPWDVTIRPGWRVEIFIMKDIRLPAQEEL